MDSKSYFENGLEKINKKDFHGAIEDFTIAINIGNESSLNLADIYFKRAVAYFLVINPEQSTSDLLKAGELDPKYNNQELFWNEF